MKKLIALAIVAVFMFSANALAEDTGGENYTDPNFLTKILGRSLEHDHQYTLNKDMAELELGVIAEVIVYKDILAGIPYSVGAEGQYVWETGDWGIYGKVIVDLSPMVKGLIGRE